MNGYIDCCKVRSYCIRNNLFTGGTNSQYAKMFECENVHDKAVMIWLCSKTDKSVSDIENDLIALMLN